MRPQVNLRLPEDLKRSAERYAKLHKYGNLQELATEALREKIMKDRNYDESFTEKEIELIDSLITATIKKGKFVSKEELFKGLK